MIAIIIIVKHMLGTYLTHVCKSSIFEVQYTYMYALNRQFFCNAKIPEDIDDSLLFGFHGLHYWLLVILCSPNIRPFVLQVS